MSDRPSLLPVSICIIAYNEEAHIASCLDSVADRAAEVVVLNAESTDKTAEIVERYRQKYPGVVLMTAPNTFKYNINKMKTFHKATQPWIFYLDADERLTPELWDEIGDVIETDRYDGYLVGRKNFYFGKWMRFGGMYPEKQPRLFRQGKGSFSLEHVHATLDIDGPVGELEQPFLHYTYETMTQFLRKMDTYTTFQAELWRQSGVRWSAGNHWRYGLIRPLLRFGQKYLYLQGFRDGFLGFFAGIMAAVSEFLAYVKVKVEDAE